MVHSSEIIFCLSIIIQQRFTQRFLQTILYLRTKLALYSGSHLLQSCLIQSVGYYSQNPKSKTKTLFLLHVYSTDQVSSQVQNCSQKFCENLYRCNVNLFPCKSWEMSPQALYPVNMVLVSCTQCLRAIYRWCTN